MRVILNSVPAKRTRELTQRALTVVGTLSLGYCLTILLGVKFYQVSEAREFAKELRQQAQKKTAALSSIALVPKRSHGPRAGISRAAGLNPLP